MKKFNQIIGTALCGFSMLALCTPASALTNYKADDWNTKMPKSECVTGETDCTGYAAGSAEQVDDTNETKIAGNAYKGNKATEPTKWQAMQVGPYVEGGTDTAAQGIHEELQIELDKEKMLHQQFFEISFSLKDDKDAYVNEINVITENIDGVFYIGIQGIDISGGKWNETPLAKVSEEGVYTYSWEIKNGSVTFNVKAADGTVVGGKTLTIDDNFKGPDVQKISEVGADKVSVRWIWFCNVQTKEAVSVFSKPEVVAEPEVSGGAVTTDEETSNVLTETLKNSTDKELQELLANHDATVELNAKETTPLDKEKKEFADALPNATISKYLDISVVVKAGETKRDIHELTDEITLTVKVPENLPEVKEGYTRVYYILREHNGKVEVLDTLLSDDGKELSFATDKFSTYALAYVDEANAENTPENPNTGDNIASVVAMGAVSVMAMTGIAVVAKKKENI